MNLGMFEVRIMGGKRLLIGISSETQPSHVYLKYSGLSYRSYDSIISIGRTEINPSKSDALTIVRMVDRLEPKVIHTIDQKTEGIYTIETTPYLCIIRKYDKDDNIDYLFIGDRAYIQNNLYYSPSGIRLKVNNRASGILYIASNAQEIREFLWWLYSS